MASSGIQIQNPPTGGISMIVAKGAVYHMLGPLVPAGDNVPKFAQLYIMDNELDKVDKRMSHFVNVYMTRDLLHRLQVMLHDFNPLVRQFRQTIQDIRDLNHALEEREIFISTNGDVDHRCYNAPTGLGQNEVAGIMPGSEDSGLDKRREIRIRAKGNPNDLHFISDAHKFYDSLHFVLFHPRGEQGWEKDGILLLNPPQRQRRPRKSNTTQSLLADEADEGVDGNEENDLQASDERTYTSRKRKTTVCV